ncbi:hypothetical protein MSPP1_000929 [Malassezia sp. CBS 17886]|nr:hypothetical protein MSPP1_000929 [Malassezia sp. CBS 17886]
MSLDPYDGFAHDIERALRDAEALRGRAHSDGDARRKLGAAVAALRQDLGDLRQTVRVVEQSDPARFGIDARELDRRRAFVHRSEAQLEQMDAVANGASVARDSGTARGIQRYRDRDGDRGEGAAGPIGSGGVRGDGDPAPSSLAWEKEQQQMLLAHQDVALGQIGTSLSTLRSQAQRIGLETDEQVVMIGELDTDVDNTQTRLQHAVKRMDRMVAQTDAWLSGWFVWVLIVVLFLLLLVVILV